MSKMYRRKCNYCNKYYIGEGSKFCSHKCYSNNSKGKIISKETREKISKVLKENKVNVKHGMEGTRTYRSWISMKTRCLNKKDEHYPKYNGRGIMICERWLKFENFYKDMGKRPKGTCLDRIDNNGNYEPNNCRWATAKEQLNNTRLNRVITYKGRTQTMSQWAEEIGLRIDTFWKRLNAGWNIKKTIETPKKVRQFINCKKCGQKPSQYPSRGLCNKCYQKEYYKKQKS